VSCFVTGSQIVNRQHKADKESSENYWQTCNL